MDTATPARPNVIWIFGDQHRAQALGCAGDPNVHTPNIDRLAEEGLTFTGAVGGCPLCSPYRGALLSGRYPHNSVPGHEHRLLPAQPTIAHAFNDAGYHTAYFGKWHVDGFHERNGRAAMHIVPPERRGGFQQWVGYENNNSQWDCWVHGGRGATAVLCRALRAAAPRPVRRARAVDAAPYAGRDCAAAQCARHPAGGGAGAA